MVSIEYSQFPTHTTRRVRKTMPDKMVKINNNAIYNGGVATYDRAVVMDGLHTYLAFGGDVILRKFKVPYKAFFLELLFCVPINYGSVSLRKGNICWKPAKKDYAGVWDVGNYGDIWNKAFEDALQIYGVIGNDDFRTIRGHGVEFREVATLKERKLVFNFYERE